MKQDVIDAVALELERRGIEGVANEGRPGEDELGSTSGLSIYNVDIRTDSKYLVGIAWEGGEPYFTFASNVRSSSDDVECIADWILSICEYLGTDDYQRTVLSGENSLSYCPPPPRPTLEGRAKRRAHSVAAGAFKFPRDRGGSEGTSGQEPFRSDRRSQGSGWSGSYLPRTTAIPLFDFCARFFAASRTRASPFGSLSRLGVRHEFGSCVFSLASGLSSTASAGDFAPLFGCFAGTTPLYDSPPPFMKDLPLIAFSFRPA